MPITQRMVWELLILWGSSTWYMIWYMCSIILISISLTKFQSCSFQICSQKSEKWTMALLAREREICDFELVHACLLLYDVIIFLNRFFNSASVSLLWWHFISINGYTLLWSHLPKQREYNFWFNKNPVLNNPSLLIWSA